MLRKDSSDIVCTFCGKPAIKRVAGNPVCKKCVNKAKDIKEQFKKSED